MKNIELTFWRNTGLGAAAALLLTACAPGQDAPAPIAGVDVSYYVAVGDSYTAGLSAGGLTRASQEYSYPNLLARQLRLVAPNVPFTQPLLEAGSGTGYLALAGFAPGEVPLTRRVAGTAVRRQVINSAACGGPDTVRLFTRSQSANALPQNLGLPGLLLGQIEIIGLGNRPCPARRSTRISSVCSRPPTTAPTCRPLRPQRRRLPFSPFLPASTM